LATGMLPICFGRATRFCQYLLSADKSYLVGFKLGVKTTTGDAEGDVVSKSEVPSISLEQMEESLSPFRGEIWQVPSMYSALKHQGRPLYEYARQGITIEREPRKLFISELAVLSHEEDYVCCKVSCSKGTYIRSLVEDIGDLIGCGAHVTELRRFTVGSFDARNMLTIDVLQSALDQDLNQLDDYLMPLSSSVTHLPSWNLSSHEVKKMRQGCAVTLERKHEKKCVALYTPDKKFLGVGEIQESGLSLKAKQWAAPGT